MPEIVPASPAATVVLARHGASPVEVLLMRRHADLAFLAGAYVFPGGRVDEEDGMSGPAGLDPPHETPRIPGIDVAGELPLRVAAIRELGVAPVAAAAAARRSLSAASSATRAVSGTGIITGSAASRSQAQPHSMNTVSVTRCPEPVSARRSSRRYGGSTWVHR